MTSRPRILALCVMALFATLGQSPKAVLGATNASAPAMVVTFVIRDYTSWRPVFDAAGAERAKAGVTNGRVYRNADKRNDLLVVFDVADEAKGRAWMTSAAVKAAWKAGGVIGEPVFRFLR